MGGEDMGGEDMDGECENGGGLGPAGIADRPEDAPVARCAQGALRGRHRRGVQLFAGIPYAAPPVGERRFRAPEPHESWEGERDASR
jgi:hypothetical protein